ncbi:uncharacterized protein LOC121255183 [Juglans microcarpa x Juglans regia]|uniref:uncharacterized protein LOC121255183 n=1 Tax=Juglans microcarpa x Juglans regia TaxID=2249226 RepID=UPI001B7E1EFA|nr:uncharacterized protein LOC121255183 [Juglans microcarpa x Juglans regia]
MVWKVLTEYPIGKILQKPDSLQRLVAWSVELNEFDINYVPRSGSWQKQKLPPHGIPWLVFFDGSACRAGGGIWIYIISEEGQEDYYIATLTFKTTNNEAKYEALIASHSVVRALGDTEIEVKIPREDNSVANRLAKAASGTDEIDLPWEVQRRLMVIPAIGLQVNQMGTIESKWAKEIVKYIDTKKFPKEKEKAKKIKRRAARLIRIEGILYKKGFATPILRCFSPEEAQYVFAEIHEGVCINHSSEKALAKRVVKVRYYWLNALRDAKEFVNKCTKCRIYAPISRCPPEKLISITVPWQFTQWEVDLAEAEALAIVAVESIGKFLWKNIICHFGIPQSIIFDNRKQFDSKHYREWCKELRIQAKYSSQGHPQAKGQAEATNKSLLGILKMRLTYKKGEWVEELTGVLWAYKTTVKTPIGETPPFTLAFGSEVVTPVEVGLPTHRTCHFSQSENGTALKEQLDLLEEKRDEVQNILNKGKTKRYFNKRVMPRTFRVGDLVLKEVGVTIQDKG